MIREDFENNVDNIIINRYAALYNEEPHANMIRRLISLTMWLEGMFRLAA